MKHSLMVGGYAACCALAWAATAAADCSQQYFVYGQQALYLADRVSVGASPVGSGQFAELGVNTVVHGDLVSTSINLRNHALLNGSAFTSNPVSGQLGAQITGQVLPIAANQLCAAPSLPVITPGSGDEFVSGTLELPPGHYGDVSVGVDSTLILSSGEYHFASLVFEPDTQLIGIWQGAPARVLVSEAVSFGDRHEQRAVRAAGSASTQSVIEVISAQSHQLRLGTDAIIAARIIAPFAEVNVPSRTVVQAPLYGLTVRVEPDVTIGRPVPPLNPTVCQ